MATGPVIENGFDENLFENPVSENFKCGICLNVLNNPKSCQNNQHYFCSGCIHQHLQNSDTCPQCMEELTQESLGTPPRLVLNCIAELPAMCKYNDRGCSDRMQFGSLQNHVDQCGYAPVICGNEGCGMEIIARDRIHHKSELCEFRQVQCHNCEELRKEVIKLVEKQDELNISQANLGMKINQVTTQLQNMEKHLLSELTELLLANQRGTHLANQLENEVFVNEISEVKCLMKDVLLKLSDINSVVCQVKIAEQHHSQQSETVENQYIQDSSSKSSSVKELEQAADLRQQSSYTSHDRKAKDNSNSSLAGDRMTFSETPASARECQSLSITETSEPRDEANVHLPRRAPRPVRGIPSCATDRFNDQRSCSSTGRTDSFLNRSVASSLTSRSHRETSISPASISPLVNQRYSSSTPFASESQQQIEEGPTDSFLDRSVASSLTSRSHRETSISPASISPPGSQRYSSSTPFASESQQQIEEGPTGKFLNRSVASSLTSRSHRETSISLASISPIGSQIYCSSTPFYSESQQQIEEGPTDSFLNRSVASSLISRSHRETSISPASISPLGSQRSSSSTPFASKSQQQVEEAPTDSFLNRSVASSLASRSHRETSISPASISPPGSQRSSPSIPFASESQQQIEEAPCDSFLKRSVVSSFTSRSPLETSISPALISATISQRSSPSMRFASESQQKIEEGKTVLVTRNFGGLITGRLT